MNQDNNNNKDVLIKHIVKATIYCAQKCGTLKNDNEKILPEQAECLNQCGFAYAASIYHQGEFFKYMQEVQEQVNEFE